MIKHRIHRLRALIFTACCLVAITGMGQDLSPAPTLSSGNASAVGDLLVSPTRLVFDGPRRTAEVTLINVGNSTATYRISLLHLRMKADGSVEEFGDATASDRVADALVRYSPRQVVLEPRVAQTVRIQLRKPAELAAGEYRSHLLFRGVPKPEDVSPEASDTSGLSIRLVPVYGVSIPVIVRHGQTSARATLTDLELVPGGGEGQPPFYIRANLERDGNRSVYGNFRVTSNRLGRDQILGATNGVAIYDAVPSRRVMIPVTPPKDVKLNGSRLRVALFDAEKDDAGSDLLAEAFLDIP